jgi:hypothetical protein
MTFLAVSLLVFSITILSMVILGLIWWKKYGKGLFSTMKNLNNMPNPENFMKNMGNMENLGDFNKRMGQFMKNMDKFK